MIEKWVYKLIDGEVLAGQDAAKALRAHTEGRLAVLMALAHLERGDVDQAQAVLREFVQGGEVLPLHI